MDDIFILDQQECTLEYMKIEYIGERWLKGVRQHYFEAFVNCLLPCPPEYAQVGGNWYVTKFKNIFIIHYKLFNIMRNFILGTC